MRDSSIETRHPQLLPEALELRANGRTDGHLQRLCLIEIERKNELVHPGAKGIIDGNPSVRKKARLTTSLGSRSRQKLGCDGGEGEFDGCSHLGRVRAQQIRVTA